MMQTLEFLCFAAALLIAPVSTEESARKAPTLTWEGSQVHLPTPSKGGRSLVAATVGGAGPFDFLIDTGASLSVLDTGTAALLGLEAVSSMEIGAPGGGTVPTDIVEAPEIKVGGLSITGAHPIVLGISEMSGGLIQGVLGMDLFTEVVLSLDPAAGQATVSRQRLQPGNDGVIPIDTSEGRLNFEIQVAGRAVTAHIDTGAPGGITLPIELMQELPLQPGPSQQGSATLVGGQRQLTFRTLDGTVQVGELEWTDPEVTFMDPSPGAANLGSGLMAELVLTIDAHSQLMALRKSAEVTTTTPTRLATTPSRSAPRRLGVGFQGSPTTGFTAIRSVDPGSLGEELGFRAGDKLLALNGRPMSDFDTASLGQLIRGGEELRWELERDGNRLVILVR